MKNVKTIVLKDQDMSSKECHVTCNAWVSVAVDIFFSLKNASIMPIISQTLDDDHVNS